MAINKYVDSTGVRTIKNLVRTDIEDAVSTKQDTINDLNDIRSGAALGETSVQEESILTDQDIEDAWTPDSSEVEKGQIIMMNLDNSIDRPYRVLSIHNNIASVVAMFSSTDSQRCNNSLQTVVFSNGATALQYMNSALDQYLNETWFSKLTNEAKAAIVEVERIQDLWGSDSPGDPYFIRQGKYQSLYAYKKTGTSPIGNRKVYALNIQEIFDYLEMSTEDAMTWASLHSIFWNDTFSHPNQGIWLASAYSTRGNSLWVIDPNDENLNFYKYDISTHVHPAFTIDLSKIDFTVEGGNN